ncbi:tetratricopeptide repeat protein [Lichenicoccus sp.]|uniref:tetratricopeptide repeat protein n=1 Tax=Lichenicoccus sp. TaxID=2781899 RepID=UPI003D0CC271
MASAATPPGQDAAQQAERAFTAHDVQRARTLWQSLAASGDAEAAFRLGLLADAGNGEPQDATRAYRWFRQAADAGLSEAEFNVAAMKDGGRGTPLDEAGAATWYARAAGAGNRRAEYDLGLLYDAGTGVPRNPAAARAWFRQAASSGLPAASDKLKAPDPDTGGANLQPSASLHPAAPVTPKAGETVALPEDRAVVFVWTAPADAQTVRYFLQVVAQGQGPEREIHAGYVDVTAKLVALDATAHDYVWRVFTVSPQAGRYTVTPWTAFKTRDRG